ncbi:MAG: YdeI/OmpD-associated family protein [Solirubrobacterales bacterium]
MKIPSPDALPVTTFTDADAFETWLDANFESAAGVWIAVAKKSTGVASVSHAQALDVALCFGWIDGQRRAHDETYFLQRFTPRRARSPWSQINRDKVLALIDAGRMRPSGQAEIDRAQQDGRWEAAYAGARTSTIPEDLQRELDADPAAAAFFKTLSSQNRYSITYRLNEAKKPETRERRLAKFMAMLRSGETVHPQ